ncbi:MAG: hypothetical protein ABI353_04230 [Isosphaeraceae bacterium]
MSLRQNRIERITGVYQEYLAARVAVDLLDQELKIDPGFLTPQGVRGRVARSLRANLETTYFIRLYAEFEGGLRDFWGNALGQDTQPPMRDLLSAITARRVIPYLWALETDKVRQFRNALVHERPAELMSMPIYDSYQSLCRYFSRLPSYW